MKITEYSRASAFVADSVLLTDGTSGTKVIGATDAILSALSLISPKNHRNIFRGKNLGNTLTNAQKVAIQMGTFDDLWLGDYWEINNVKWRIVDFDYWYGNGDTAMSSHHLVIMPDTNLATATMNSSGTTAGGYTGSAMYTANLNTAKTAVTAAFDTAVKTHREYLINAVTSGYPSAGAWADSTVDLPNEPMIFGSYIYTPAGNGTINVKRYTNSPTQLALFAAHPEFILGDPEGTHISYWLRDVANATSFVRVSSYGAPQDTSASQSYGIRPVFAIG